jgi:hypothetical protein
MLLRDVPFWTFRSAIEYLTTSCFSSQQFLYGSLTPIFIFKVTNAFRLVGLPEVSHVTKAP